MGFCTNPFCDGLTAIRLSFFAPGINNGTFGLGYFPIYFSDTFPDGVPNCGRFDNNSRVVDSPSPAIVSLISDSRLESMCSGLSCKPLSSLISDFSGVTGRPRFERMFVSRGWIEMSAVTPRDLKTLCQSEAKRVEKFSISNITGDFGFRHSQQSGLYTQLRNLF